MRRHKRNFERKGEEGIIIILVAVFLLFVVGAMAALSIDVTTFYTARSEAQLAADSAALAGARVLANSGMTSSTDAALAGNAGTLATNIATLVAQQNQIGGSTPTVTINISNNTQGNPHVTVRVSRSDVPTFFARIWGTTQVTVAASATAEAYNPSGMATSSSTPSPVAPSCVKPWLVPNIDPSGTSVNGDIFLPTSGAIQPTGLLGWQSPSVRLHAACTGTACTSPPQMWQYYQGAESSFPHPTQGLPGCTLSSNFQMSIAGCVQTPIACGSSVSINVVLDGTLDPDTANAVDCMANLSSNKGDKMNPNQGPPAPTPFEFIADDDNPLVQAGVLASGADVMVSNSLVTVPIFDNSGWVSTTPPATVQVIGFVQLFLQPLGNHVPATGIRTRVINMVGCGTNATGTPVYGNGASAVPVRLISPP